MKRRKIGFLLGLELLLLAISSVSCLAASAPRPPPVVVAGAGPASLVFAHRLLSQHPSINIEIHERRSRPPLYEDSVSDEAGDQAFGFGIGSRAQLTLSKIPKALDRLEAISEPSAFAGGFLINRRDMCAELIQILEEDYGIDGSGRLKICFNSAIQDLCRDDEGGSCYAIVKTRNGGETFKVLYSLLVAGDGTHSAVRNALIRQRYLEGKKYLSTSTWKALQLPSQPKIMQHQKASLRWKTKVDTGRLLPRYRNRYVLLNFRKRSESEPNPFGASTPRELKTAILSALPNVTEFPDDDILQDFLEQPAGETSYMTLNRHCVPEMNVVLIGDSAVGMYSLLGQGVASAMESSALLADELSKDKNCFLEEDLALSEALYRFSNTTFVETKALADMNLLAHLISRPIIKLLGLAAFAGIAKGLANTPDVPYSEMYHANRRILRLSKLFWRLDRIPVPILEEDHPEGASNENVEAAGGKVIVGGVTTDQTTSDALKM